MSDLERAMNRLANNLMTRRDFAAAQGTHDDDLKALVCDFIALVIRETFPLPAQEEAPRCTDMNCCSHGVHLRSHCPQCETDSTQWDGDPESVDGLDFLEPILEPAPVPPEGDVVLRIVHQLRCEASASEELAERADDSDIPTMRQAADLIERLARERDEWKARSSQYSSMIVRNSDREDELERRAESAEAKLESALSANTQKTLAYHDVAQENATLRAALEEIRDFGGTWTSGRARKALSTLTTPKASPAPSARGDDGA